MSTSDYTDDTPNPEDTAPVILSPITKALNKNKLTLNRLTKDLDDVIKTTKDNPSAKLKGLDMGFKLSQAYPAEKLKIESDTDIIINLVQYGQPDKLPKRITEDKE